MSFPVLASIVVGLLLLALSAWMWCTMLLIRTLEQRLRLLEKVVNFHLRASAPRGEDCLTIASPRG